MSRSRLALLATRSLPDVLSVGRMLLSPAIPLAAGSRRTALTLAALCAVSDATDGALARRAGTASERGARLDSLADVVFFLSLMLAVTRVLPPRQRRVVAGAALPVGAVRAASALTSRMRLGQTQSLHTRGNRAAGVAIAAGALAVLAGAPAASLAPGLVAALAAAIGEYRLIATMRPRPPGRPTAVEAIGPAGRFRSARRFARPG